ncbi:hypothetical protein GCM10023322_61320 [Rugosimonospora acidiphila]|uniref:Uncharacterized protein n=1 Tax=Rugosimonospora acidiphila TaxID=556531 RepID=A0ABP9SHB6_9ACTN
MRHIATLIAAIFIGPLAWILIAFGQERSATAFARAGSSGAFHTGDFVRPLAYLAVAGVLIGLIATLRFSPLGAVLTGVVYVLSYVWLLVDPDELLDLFKRDLDIFGRTADPTVPVRTGTTLIVGALLLVSVLSAKRWRRWPRPVLAEVAGPSPEPVPEPIEYDLGRLGFADTDAPRPDNEPDTLVNPFGPAAGAPAGHAPIPRTAPLIESTQPAVSHFVTPTPPGAAGSRMEPARGEDPTADLSAPVTAPARPEPSTADVSLPTADLSPPTTDLSAPAAVPAQRSESPANPPTLDEPTPALGEPTPALGEPAPALDEPAPDESARGQLVMDEPSRNESARSEPVTDEPARDESAVAASTGDEPIGNEPTVDEPTVDEPTVATIQAAKPSDAEPIDSAPAGAAPSQPELALTEPNTAEPNMAEPTRPDPSPAEASTAEPSTAEPSTAEPSTVEPVQTESSQAPSTETPSTETPVAETPLAETPSTEAPLADAEPDREPSPQAPPAGDESSPATPVRMSPAEGGSGGPARAEPVERPFDRWAAVESQAPRTYQGRTPPAGSPWATPPREGADDSPS